MRFGVRKMEQIKEDVWKIPEGRKQELVDLVNDAGYSAKLGENSSFGIFYSAEITGINGILSGYCPISLIAGMEVRLMNTNLSPLNNVDQYSKLRELYDNFK